VCVCHCCALSLALSLCWALENHTLQQTRILLGHLLTSACISLTFPSVLEDFLSSMSLLPSHYFSFSMAHILHTSLQIIKRHFPSNSSLFATNHVVFFQTSGKSQTLSRKLLSSHLHMRCHWKYIYSYFVSDDRGPEEGRSPRCSLLMCTMH